MKIALLGLFGSGNTGNDGSLESMVSFLRRSTPDAELLCICPNPEVVTGTLAIAAVGHGSIWMTGYWSALANRLLAARSICRFSAASRTSAAARSTLLWSSRTFPGHG
ncbi:hypothetical protein [Phyllobacterium sp. LjRoot231]|uniref:hypothetical protein n=1 Tax=Phyllobacterium sp. LjRoot231 TaxID=3342289 RepID=UPI003F50A948